MQRVNCIAVLAILTALPSTAEMRVAAADAMRAATKKIAPDYNPMAKQMRVQGEVEVEARISEAGDVTDVKVVSGNALLTPSVVKAVKDWKFAPFLENGKASPAVAALRFSFKL
ncbi:MAG: energy transducer TonB [Acidobacteria bacterium]|nr:energy transducer TonB [Acidobacteriota bacterium]